MRFPGSASQAEIVSITLAWFLCWVSHDGSLPATVPFEHAFFEVCLPCLGSALVSTKEEEKAESLERERHQEHGQYFVQRDKSTER